jgi:glycine betaine/choline ABC-type transport system substrate-binding protein
VDAGAFAALLDAVAPKMTTEELTRLGVEVAVNNRDVKEVATEWLTANGLLTSE